MADVDPFASATELLAALRARRVTPSELTDLLAAAPPGGRDRGRSGR
jgi:hypothetical protein